MPAPQFSYRQALKDAALVALIAMVLAVPIVGIKLAGYEYTVRLHWPLIGVAVVFAGRFVAVWASHTERGAAVLLWFSKTRSQSNIGVVDARLGTRSRLLLAGVLVASLIVPFGISNYMLGVVTLALIYVLLGLGLNIVVGLAGLLDLGFVAFYAVGAYVFALGGFYLDIGFWLAIPLAALCAAFAGAVLGFPVLRMHGDYLAIVTLGFGEIIRLILNNWTDFTGGPNGMRAPGVTLFGLEFKRRSADGITFHDFFGLEYSSTYRYLLIYFVLLVMVCAMIVLVVRLRSMPIGRAWEALREDEIACRSLGINHVTVKLSAFMMGAMTGGVAGVFFGALQGFVSPASFVFFESALILAIVVLGGMGSTLGVVIAAIVLTILPEVLREVAEYRLLAFGSLMVLLMIWKPRGLVRVNRPTYEARSGLA